MYLCTALVPTCVTAPAIIRSEADSKIITTVKRNPLCSPWSGVTLAFISPPRFILRNVYEPLHVQTESHLNVSLALNEITLCTVPRTVCNLIITSRLPAPLTLAAVTVHHSLPWERASTVHLRLHCDVSHKIHVYSRPECEVWSVLRT
jgi:hypothetical protein